jgi:hypothetical protein
MASTNSAKTSPAAVPGSLTAHGAIGEGRTAECENEEKENEYST